MLRAGESYPAPRDDFLDLQQLALEDPGVLAGFSHQFNLPMLSGNPYQVAFNINYLQVPLVRRMDLDRVYRACLESGKFYDVYPYGMGKDTEEATIYKANPWEHMNCYTLKAKLKQQDPWHTIGAIIFPSFFPKPSSRNLH